MGKTERKREQHSKKRKIVNEINDHFSKNTTSVLAEVESMSSYSRKRSALSYEQPTTPKCKKTHTPKDTNMTWDIEGAMKELENFPPNQKINWSSVARKHAIPQRCDGQVLKETAAKHGIDTFSLI